MKYKTKYDIINNRKNEVKQVKQSEELYSGHSLWVDMETMPEGATWSTHPFHLLYGNRESKKPVRNLYKEIIRLSKYVCQLQKTS